MLGVCLLHLNWLTGMKRNPAWMETFSVQFLGSVEVPHHQGNGILCAAMQKVSYTKKSPMVPTPVRLSPAGGAVAVY